MRSINKVILIGNLTRDPELRQTPNGQNVVTFGLATNREWVTRDGRKQTSAEFHDLVAWAKLAEFCHNYLKKGKLVYVEGYLKTRSWDTPEGVKKFRTEIVVQDMIMLDKRNDGDNTEDYIPENESGYDYNSDNDDTGSEQKQEEPKQQTPAKEPVKEDEPTEEPKRETPAPAPTPAPTAPAQESRPNEKPAEEPKEEQKKDNKLDIDSDLGL